MEPFMYLAMNTWFKRDLGVEFGWGNGYVALPKGHKYYQVDYDDIPVDVHGGLTYSQQMGDYWVVGFDTAHFSDTIEKWPMEAVLAETQKLFDQLNTL